MLSSLQVSRLKPFRCYNFSCKQYVFVAAYTIPLLMLLSCWSGMYCTPWLCNILHPIALLVAAESGRGTSGHGVWLLSLSWSAAIIAIFSEVDRL